MSDANAETGGSTVAAAAGKTKAGEALRFLAVGIGSVSVDFVVYFALILVLPAVSVAFAKGVSFVAGACFAFVMNRTFVFRAHARPASRQLLPFALLYATTLGANTLANSVTLALVDSRLFAWLVATGTSTVCNYLGMKFVVFRKGEEPRYTR
jgi:putative flippase GtrA